MRDSTLMRRTVRGSLRGLSLAGALGLAVVVGASPSVAAPAPSSFAQARVAVDAVVSQQATTIAPPNQSSVPVSSVVTAIEDPASTRTVNRIITALVVLGAVLLIVTIWFFVATRPLHPALEALDVMSSRRWGAADAAKRADMLASVHAARGALDDRLLSPRPEAVASGPAVVVGQVVGEGRPPS